LIQPAAPHPAPLEDRRDERGVSAAASAAATSAATSARLVSSHCVALQVAFERQTLKPVFHLIGYRLWVLKAIGYGLWVNLIQRAPPHHCATFLGVCAHAASSAAST
jgi:hypothetical protein